MKPRHYSDFFSMPAKQPLLCLSLFMSCIAPVALAANSNEALADPTPTLALYQTVDNNTEPACAFDLPGYGSGTSVKLLPKKTCPKVEDKVIDPHSLRIRNVPIATRFLLTSVASCDKSEKNAAWIELETTRANASLEKLGIDKLWTYSGYVTNSGLDSNAPSRGFKVTAKGDPIKQGSLSCIQVTTSAGSN
ncbi:hypothetical protein ACIP1G_26670 [Pseudomonas sp. NPDC089392]|uniref:hypothetical protein n=1 Tax=Pseudomonas sp. NPDC089392 TaxID=3364459 RepID=UPI00382E7A4D